MFSPNVKGLWVNSLCVGTHFVPSYTRHWLQLPQNLWKCVECAVQRLLCVFGYKMCPHTWATSWIMRSNRWLWMRSKFQAEDLEDCGGFCWYERSKWSYFFGFLGVVQSHLSYFVKVLFSFLILGVLVWPICFFVVLGFTVTPKSVGFHPLLEPEMRRVESWIRDVL